MIGPGGRVVMGGPPRHGLSHAPGASRVADDRPLSKTGPIMLLFATLEP